MSLNQKEEVFDVVNLADQITLGTLNVGQLVIGEILRKMLITAITLQHYQPLVAWQQCNLFDFGLGQQNGCSSQLANLSLQDSPLIIHIFS